MNFKKIYQRRATSSESRREPSAHCGIHPVLSFLNTIDAAKDRTRDPNDKGGNVLPIKGESKSKPKFCATCTMGLTTLRKPQCPSRELHSNKVLERQRQANGK